MSNDIYKLFPLRRLHWVCLLLPITHPRAEMLLVTWILFHIQKFNGVIAIVPVPPTYVTRFLLQ